MSERMNEKEGKGREEKGEKRKEREQYYLCT